MVSIICLARWGDFSTHKSRELKYSLHSEAISHQNWFHLEGLMLKLKLQYFGHLMWRAHSVKKDTDAGKERGQEEKGATEDMVGWHHWLKGRECEHTLGDSGGQRSLACCSQWGHNSWIQSSNWTTTRIKNIIWYWKLYFSHCNLPPKWGNHAS